MPLVNLLAQTDAPAKGTAASEIIAASLVAGVAVVAVLVLAALHRKRQLLTPLARWVEERTGDPAWAVLPALLTSVALLVAVFGYYWDVSWHIDRGRDPGPFANPAHWFIIIGLDGIAFAGILALVLGDDRDTGASVRLTSRWKAPVGAVLLMVCGLIALAGFPLDDLWHRLFGQDVTAWGPTHIQMIGGASLATLAVWALWVEGTNAEGIGEPPDQRTRGAKRVRYVRDVIAGGAFLIGLSTLQVEFDFGVPQFRQLAQPVLVMLAAGIGLVTVRLRAGRGGALGAALFFCLVRGALALAIGPGFGRSVPHFPLYLVAAVVVELVALRIPRDRQLTFGLVAGIGIGTVGLAAEWAWSHVWMPLPWGTSLLPEGAVLAFVAAVAAGVLGGLAGRALAAPSVARQPTPRGAAVGAWLVAAACLATIIPMTEHTDWKARLSVSEASLITGPDERQSFVTVGLEPRDAARDAHWFHVLAWQGAPNGDGGMVRAELVEVADGVYRTDRPVPSGGTWKTLLRLQRDDSLQAVPIFMPADSAIPAPEVPLPDGEEVRAFQREKSILQREALTDNVGLERGAYTLLALLAGAWMVSIAWGLRRLDRATRSQPESRPPSRASGRRARPVTTG